MEDDDFAWHDEKNLQNKELGRLGFEDVRLMWGDPNHVIGAGKTKDGEERYIIVAKLNGKFWICVYTIRGNQRRIISFRRTDDNKYKRMYNEKK